MVASFSMPPRLHSDARTAAGYLRMSMSAFVCASVTAAIAALAADDPAFQTIMNADAPSFPERVEVPA